MPPIDLVDEGAQQSELDLQEQLVLEQLQYLHDELAARRAEQRAATDTEDAMNGAKERAGLMVAPPNKIIVCTAHKPVRLEKPHGVDTYEYSESTGSLKAAVEALEAEGNTVLWVSWPGTSVGETLQEGVRKRLAEEYKTKPVFFSRELEELFYVKFCHGVLWPLFHCIPSMATLSTAQRASSQHATHSISRGELVGARATEQYEAYARVNQLYLEAIAEVYTDGDVVLVYDYELMLLPALVRKRFPDALIAFFLQCPFPSSEHYRMLPQREALLHGTLGADLVSFNHFDYVRHYLNACMRVLGLESSPSRLEYNGRVVSVSICPAGIDPTEFEEEPPIVNYATPLLTPAVSEKSAETVAPLSPASSISSPLKIEIAAPAEEATDESSPASTSTTRSRVGTSSSGLASPTTPMTPVRPSNKKHELEDVERIVQRMRSGAFKKRKIILSLDSLDITKGIPQKILALESLLEQHPDWRGKAVLLLAARDRGRPYNSRLRKAVDGLVGHINGRFGKSDYVPVMYFKHNLPRVEVAALYQIADVLFVASVREGINLSALEFVACQSARRGTHSNNTVGVLVYSEFAGCASSFEDGALVVNPYDTDASALALHKALIMSRTTKQVRQHKLARYVNAYTAQLWATRLVNELKLAHEKASEYTQQCPLDVAQIRSHYERSKRRLLIFEYDGALETSNRSGVAAQPSNTLISCLKHLCADDANTVYVTSGRRREDLRSWLGDLPRLGLVAEFGYWLKQARGEEEPLYSAIITSIGFHNSPVNISTSAPEIPHLQIPASLEEGDVSPNERRRVNEEVHSSSTVGERVLKSGIDLSWHAEVIPILESFTRQTPGSFLERNESCLTWHYRDADPSVGRSQAKDLQLHLDVVLTSRPIRVVTSPARQCIVLHPSRVSKGRALRAAVDQNIEKYDLILAICDDDAVFELFKNSTHAFLCTVGSKLTRAPYHLDEAEVIPMLQTLAAVSKDMPVSPSLQTLSSNLSIASSAATHNSGSALPQCSLSPTALPRVLAARALSSHHEQDDQQDEEPPSMDHDDPAEKIVVPRLLTPQRTVNKSFETLPLPPFPPLEGGEKGAAQAPTPPPAGAASASEASNLQ